ncbi:4713_t:CDS:2 [Cetraspora pellucida]|uniref:4713_t:CDS:1 n=1 Tax=Cetraspora pellucida TaxID=1433469 RepID=A0ACA9LCZ7_9GLOM|nr:4713_t:CDS:2 [Cetraspora pellucida]
MNLNVTEPSISNEILNNKCIESLPNSNGASVIVPEYVTNILPSNYNYLAIEIRKLPDYITIEGFSVNQFEADLMEVCEFQLQDNYNLMEVYL